MRHYTPDERARILSEWRSSGMTRKAFAQQRGVSQGSLTVWLKQSSAKDPNSSFRPLVVSDTTEAKPMTSAHPVAEVSVGSLRVRIYAGITDKVLTLLLSALRKEATC